ncbi:MAG: hypothetical protein B7Z76_14215 [Acidiphilium sp. 20-67-58]|nr:hypothetical protein [Acidiphilium sp. 20-67-58]OYV54526.1 MAG: hypothetical protein B7Z76_14215 [Acidiphilium sp. 20-67-58]HQT62525.1 hypothetical protein [Acidiphilium sp.]
MTELPPDLEAMVEPMAGKICRCKLLCSDCVDNARLAIYLGARIEMPKSPGQRAFEKAVEVRMMPLVGPPTPWKELPRCAQSAWEQIAAAARWEG